MTPGTIRLAQDAADRHKRPAFIMDDGHIRVPQYCEPVFDFRYVVFPRGWQYDPENYYMRRPHGRPT